MKRTNLFSFAVSRGGAACLTAAIAVIFVSCGPKEENSAASAPEVTVMQPVMEPVTDYLEFTGNAEASKMVQLAARVSGFLTNVTFKDGAFVNKGDLLFEIEPDPYAQKVALAEGSLASANAEQLRATLEYNRLADLVKQRAVAVAEVEKARADRDTAAAKVEQAKAQLELARIQLGYCRIAAPFNGRLDRSLKDPGNLVGVGEATLLTTIYQMDPIYAYFSINEKDLVRVRGTRDPKTETAVEGAIEGEQGYPHRGTVDFGASSLDASTGTLLLRAVFQNEKLAVMPKILPGMFMRLRIPVAQREKAILVPDRALGIDQGGRYVLVVLGDGTVDKKVVKTGALVRDLRVIDSGLSGEEQVIIAGLQQARPGSKVKPVPQQAQKPEAASAPAAEAVK